MTLEQRPPTLSIRPVGGPTAILEMAGRRIVVDPPGEYALGPLTLTKLAGPAVALDEIGPLDVALVSHDQHADNLDDAGRALLETVDTVLTTTAGAERLGGAAVGLEPYAVRQLGDLTVTAVPAQHGPEGTEEVSGPVIGFVLTAPGTGAVYVSGDNASTEVVRAINARLGPFAVALLNIGGAQVPFFDDPYVTLSNARAVEVARLLGKTTIVPLHHDGWGHFTQDSASLQREFAEAGLAERLRVIEPGRAEAV